jgi:hypothetical protein
LWDSQVAYSWYFGEAMLNHGITASIDVGTNEEMAVPHRDAVLHGKDLGPWTFTGILRIGSTLNGATGYEMPLVKTLVAHRVALVPTLHHQLPGLPEGMGSVHGRGA